MIVSNLNWQYNYWIDLSDRWAEVFSITMEDFKKLQSWLATIIDGEVVDVEQPTTEEPKQPTEEELKEAKIKEVEALITRKLAMEALWEDTTEVERKISSLSSK